MLHHTYISYCDDENNNNSADRPTSARQRNAVIQVKNSKNQVFIAKFRYCDTLAMVKTAINHHKLVTRF